MPGDLTGFPKTYVIIVAGGSGTRMQTNIPKQFLPLNGKIVLMRTIEAFTLSCYKPSIILVIHPDYKHYWQTLCSRYSFSIHHLIIDGGATRFDSVKNALALIPEDYNSLIAVHDAVRPLTQISIIDACFKAAGILGNAIVAVKSRDSVRIINGLSSKQVSRDKVFLMQTPQTFKVNQLKKAYEQKFETDFTDDASVVEKAGFFINLIEGSYTNIKITYLEDLDIAEVIIRKGL